MLHKEALPGRKLALILSLAVALLILPTGAGYAITNQPQPDRPQWVPGEVLLKLRPGMANNQISEINGKLGTKIIRYFRLINVFQLELPTNLPIEEAIQALQQESSVAYAEPNSLYYIDDLFPNDPNFGQLWGLHNAGQSGGTPDADIDAPEAWDITTGSHNVIIAVIDSGLDLTHEDIVANLWSNPGEIADNGIDDDGNGYIDDVHGWDFAANDNDPSPAGGACLGHGTHTAGTIGAVGNNGVGITGVNWNIRIMPLKAFEPVLGLFCSASNADLLAAIEYYTMMGVPISSNSWGGTNPSQAMQEAIRASNSVFVAAAGNGGLDGIGDNNDTNPQYPSSYPLDNIIAVAATNDNDQRAIFSNFGLTSVDLGAPGVNVFSTLPGNNYGSFSGTSMATPHVAGVAGLLLAQSEDLTVNEIKWRILRGTDTIGLRVLTGGRLNAKSTLQFGLSAPGVTIQVMPLSPTDLSPGDPLTLNISVTNNGTSSINVSVRLYARLSDGRELSLSSALIALDPGQNVNRTLSKSVPISALPGTAFHIFGQAETATTFDEDWVAYNIIP